MAGREREESGKRVGNAGKRSQRESGEREGRVSESKGEKRETASQKAEKKKMKKEASPGNERVENEEKRKKRQSQPTTIILNSYFEVRGTELGDDRGGRGLIHRDLNMSRGIVGWTTSDSENVFISHWKDTGLR